MDNHQTELARKMAEEGYCLYTNPRFIHSIYTYMKVHVHSTLAKESVRKKKGNPYQHLHVPFSNPYLAFHTNKPTWTKRYVHIYNYHIHTWSVERTLLN